MKKMLWLLPLMALMTLSGCSKDDEKSENKEQTQEEVVPRQLSKIYLEYQDKKWSHNGDTLLMDYPKTEYMTFAWEDDLLTNLTCTTYNDGQVDYRYTITPKMEDGILTGYNSDIEDFFYGNTTYTYALEYANGKVSKVTITDGDYEVEARTLTYGGDQLVSFHVDYDGNSYMDCSFTWSNGNIVKMETDQHFNGSVYKQVSEYTYDNSCNPLFALMPGRGVFGFVSMLSKNNPLSEHTVTTQDGEPYSEYNATYSYDYANGYPTRQNYLSTERLTDGSGTISNNTYYFEYK